MNNERPKECCNYLWRIHVIQIIDKYTYIIAAFLFVVNVFLWNIIDKNCPNGVPSSILGERIALVLRSIKSIQFGQRCRHRLEQGLRFCWVRWLLNHGSGTCFFSALIQNLEDNWCLFVCLQIRPSVDSTACNWVTKNWLSNEPV